MIDDVNKKPIIQIKLHNICNFCKLPVHNFP